MQEVKFSCILESGIRSRNIAFCNLTLLPLMAGFLAKTKTGCPTNGWFSGQTEHPIRTYIFLGSTFLMWKTNFAGESTCLKVKISPCNLPHEFKLVGICGGGTSCSDLFHSLKGQIVGNCLFKLCLFRCMYCSRD